MSNKKQFFQKYLFTLLVVLVLFCALSYVFTRNYVTINITKMEDLNSSESHTISSSKQAQVDKDLVIPPSRNVNNVPVQEQQSGSTALFNQPLSVSSGFADLVEYVSPSIVNITGIRAVHDPDSLINELNPSIRELLKQFIPQGIPITPPTIPAGGSGFVIREDGFIVTNNHVVEDTQNIQVTFANGDKYDATVYSQDPLTDLAVLKIEASNLRPLALSNYDNLRVGDWVIAVGNPFGFESTVSAGIVSAKGRQLNLSAPLTDYIQTDVAINKGNSGGPIINTKGEVVGVNTAIYSPTGGSVGISFAIPSKTVHKVVTQLIDHKKVVRSWVGIKYQPIEGDTSLAKVLQLEQPIGGLILNVMPKSPASEAKLEVGDIIYSINNEIIDDFRIVPQITSDLPPNTVVKLGIIRDGKKIVVDVTLKEAPPYTPETPSHKPITPQDLEKSQVETFDKIGFKVAQIDASVRNYFAMKKNISGVVIIAVKPGSIAQQKNMLSGYKIVSVNNNMIYSLKDLEANIKKYSDTGLLFLMENLAGARKFIPITKEELK